MYVIKVSCENIFEKWAGVFMINVGVCVYVCVFHMSLCHYQTEEDNYHSLSTLDIPVAGIL